MMNLLNQENIITRNKIKIGDHSLKMQTEFLTLSKTINFNFKNKIKFRWTWLNKLNTIKGHNTHKIQITKWKE